MSTQHDVFQVAWKAGEKVWVHARGNPAVMLAGAAAVVTTAAVYGTCKYGGQVLEALGWDK